jgi:hypothetical protein
MIDRKQLASVPRELLERWALASLTPQEQGTYQAAKAELLGALTPRLRTEIERNAEMFGAVNALLDERRWKP